MLSSHLVWWTGQRRCSPQPSNERDRLPFFETSCHQTPALLQKDGANYHVPVPCVEFSCSKFSDRIISRNKQHHLPPYAPNLSPLYLLLLPSWYFSNACEWDPATNHSWTPIVRRRLCYQYLRATTDADGEAYPEKSRCLYRQMKAITKIICRINVI